MYIYMGIVKPKLSLITFFSLSLSLSEIVQFASLYPFLLTKIYLKIQLLSLYCIANGHVKLSLRDKFSI